MSQSCEPIINNRTFLNDIRIDYDLISSFRKEDNLSDGMLINSYPLSINQSPAQYEYGNSKWIASGKYEVIKLIFSYITSHV